LVVLATQLGVKTVLEPLKGGILVSRDGHGGDPISGRVDFNLMFEGVVVEVICRPFLSASFGHFFHDAASRPARLEKGI
jgi:hypothetical protein